MERVVIVEDDKVLSLLLTKMVEKMNLEVVGTATAGRVAHQIIKKQNPDLILMDIMLEDDLDGIEVMLALRKESIDTPVIYITGNSDAYNIDRAKQTNYVDYLTKPISFDILKGSIQKVVN